VGREGTPGGGTYMRNRFESRARLQTFLPLLAWFAGTAGSLWERAERRQRKERADAPLVLPRRLGARSAFIFTIAFGASSMSFCADHVLATLRSLTGMGLDHALWCTRPLCCRVRAQAWVVQVVQVWLAVCCRRPSVRHLDTRGRGRRRRCRSRCCGQGPCVGLFAGERTVVFCSVLFHRIHRLVRLPGAAPRPETLSQAK
jgi:hypothetical protein